VKPYYVIPEVRAIADVGHSEGNRYIVHRINVPAKDRGKGYGRQLLAQILADADAEGAILMLMPLTTTDSTGLTPWQLIAWYSRHGFTLYGTGAMIRGPKEGQDK
jgi:GNAT superfamily N-acetyltransferase